MTTQSPGASNTRALTPPTEAFPEENANPPVPLLLQSSADWLQLACRVDVPHFRFAQLDRALGFADQPGSFQLARTLFQLSRVGTRGWLRHVLRHCTTRAERCPTSEKWRVLQQARFAGRQPLQRRDGHQGGAPLPLSVGMLHSTLSSTASVPALGDDTGKVDDIIRADAARFAERVIADQRLRRDYLRRRDAARGRFARWG